MYATNATDLNPISTANFRVLGIGNKITEIINQVNELGYDSVSASVVSHPSECIPDDEDKMVIIVFIDNEAIVNRIAKEFHEAGVLTIGISEVADWHCYDCVTQSTSGDYLEIIKSILQPIVTPGYICYDFYDISNSLRNSGFFTVKKAMGGSVEETVANMKNEFKNVLLDSVDYLSFNLYFNRDRPTPVKMKDLTHLTNLMSSLPDTINIIWSVHYDDTLKEKEINLTAILSGKEMSIIL